MLKKTVTYEDYNGEKRTEDFYFNLTKAELMEMELGVTGGFAESIKKIIDAKDNPSIVKIFKELVIKAYGVKSADGRRFIKNQEIIDEFVQTEAYSQIFMELATDADKASDFINGIIPKDIDRAKLEEETKKLKKSEK